MWGRGRIATLLALVGASALALWWPGVGVDIWLDEALSLHLSERPITELASALRSDGSPPLFYLILKGWTTAFGPSSHSLQTLSMIFGVIGVLGGCLLGLRRFGPRVSAIFGALAIVTPGVAFYATEARQYSLVLALSVGVTFLLLRAVDRPTMDRLVWLAVALALVAYTHNWGVFLALGACTALFVRTEGGSGARVRSTVGLAVTFSLLYLPWAAVALEQGRTSGAPWLAPPDDLSTLVVHHLSWMTGTTTATLLIIIGLALGALRVDRPEYKTLLVLLVVTVGAGWLFSIAVTPAFTHRYLTVILPATLLLLAIAAAHDRLLLVVVVGIGVIGLVSTLEVVTLRSDTFKSGARGVAELIDGYRSTDTTVVVTAEDSVLPAVYYYLADEPDQPLIFQTTRGLTDDPRLIEWPGITDAIRSWDPTADLHPALSTADYVIVLDDGDKPPELTDTEYWRARRDATSRLVADYDAHPQLEQVRCWESSNWVVIVYEVTQRLPRSGDELDSQVAARP